MVTVMRGGEEVKLSKRAGSYLTLRDLIEEVGPRRDALVPDRAQARFAADLRHRPGASAVARQPGLLRAVLACPHVRPAAPAEGTRAVASTPPTAWRSRSTWTTTAARELVRRCCATRKWSRRPAATWNRTRSPHYLLELAQTFQTYYNDHQFLVDDADTRDARLVLALATRQVLANGLELAGRQRPRGDVSGSTTRQVAGDAQSAATWHCPAGRGWSLGVAAGAWW